ncbi:MAG: zinc-binding dehydrogenase [Acidimicrobiia bacterium]|nr:zinc-binding dehydrogenase [Acidimicrobiia bacterium]
MKALRFERSPARFAAAMVAGRLAGGGGATVGPLRLRDIDDVELPGPDWVHIKPRLAGICGSDLATVDGKASRYFEPIVSFPFVPGHEVVADLIEPAGSSGTAPGSTGKPDGSHRVVLEPVLGCVARGIDPVCPACARGDLGNCERIAFGSIPPGLQSGYCCATGGGWSTAMVAHRSQLHPVDPAMSDEAAVMVEPTACAVHAALSSEITDSDTVVVLGAGTLGLLATAAIRRFTPPKTLVVVAKHDHQRRLARQLGADTVVAPGEIRRAVRRATGSLAIGDGDVVRLCGGADVVLDCVGSSASVADSLDVIRPRGRVTLVGMAGHTSLDLTPLWQRELRLQGAYAYGTETLADGTRRRTFDLAFELVAAAQLDELVSATYPLRRYAEAIAHAADAGRRGAVKVAFDLRQEKERNR